MKISYPKLVKGLYFLLLISSATFAFLEKSYPAVYIFIASIIGFISFDVVCYFKDLSKKDSKEAELLREEINQVAKDLEDIKADHSLAHLAATFKRK